MNKNRDEANVGGMQYFYDKVYRSYAAILKARCADARKPPSSLKRVVCVWSWRGGGGRAPEEEKRARNLRYLGSRG